MLSGKSNLPPRSASTEIEPTGSSPLTNEVRRSTLSETLTQANSNINSMDQHPGNNIQSIHFYKLYGNIILKFVTRFKNKRLSR